VWARLRVALLLGLMAGLLSGCAWFGGGTEPLDIDFRPLLPQEWTPIGDWQPVSIDADDTPEQLLFYSYESGQVGGVIYDPQSEAEFAPVDGEAKVLVLPNQSGTVLMVPYRLLPSYWQGEGQGYLADPGVEPTFFQARRPSNEQGQQPDDERMDELVVQGGNTHLSIFWWQDQAEGYAVTQIYAPGGLYNHDWSGRVNQSTILSVDGYFPEYDRSFFCRRATFSRAINFDSQFAGSRLRHRPTIGYLAEPRGLAFCKTEAATPDYPAFTFYPEATVLSYLLHERSQRQNVGEMVNLVNIPRKVGDPPGEQVGTIQEREQLVREVDGVVGEFDRVHSLTYYPTLDIATSRQVTTERQLQMQVIAELIVDAAEGEPASLDPDLAQRGERLYRVNFTLQYQHPYLKPDDVSTRRWDRWLIVNAIAGD
jgi:hypothetical protein